MVEFAGGGGTGTTFTDVLPILESPPTGALSMVFTLPLEAFFFGRGVDGGGVETIFACGIGGAFCRKADSVRNEKPNNKPMRQRKIFKKVARTLFLLKGIFWAPLFGEKSFSAK